MDARNYVSNTYLAKTYDEWEKIIKDHPDAQGNDDVMKQLADCFMPLPIKCRSSDNPRIYIFSHLNLDDSENAEEVIENFLNALDEQHVKPKGVLLYVTCCSEYVTEIAQECLDFYKEGLQQHKINLLFLTETCQPQESLMQMLTRMVQDLWVMDVPATELLNTWVMPINQRTVLHHERVERSMHLINNCSNKHHLMYVYGPRFHLNHQHSSEQRPTTSECISPTESEGVSMVYKNHRDRLAISWCSFHCLTIRIALLQVFVNVISHPDILSLPECSKTFLAWLSLIPSTAYNHVRVTHNYWDSYATSRVEEEPCHVVADRTLMRPCDGQEVTKKHLQMSVARQCGSMNDDGWMHVWHDYVKEQEWEEALLDSLKIANPPPSTMDDLVKSVNRNSTVPAPERRLTCLSKPPLDLTVNPFHFTNAVDWAVSSDSHGASASESFLLSQNASQKFIEKAGEAIEEEADDDPCDNLTDALSSDLQEAVGL